ncbi:PREDICTED: uncharacterized protein LOC109192895 [Ipomoea nil]|uniref:uncharacterized protein LOC109192895 n=1 Tax=Ipomoea nil TaxID=35883 RepID=UPI000900C237|nr:PREDICTED: uncharacterized protein LOC109192895 [Ipomoea nil]
MDLFLWNCQGASGKPFHRVLKNLLQVYKPNVMGIFEPKVSGHQANTICSKLGFSDWVRVEAVTQFGHSLWVFAPVYGSPTHHLRRWLWRELSQSKRGQNGPWLVAADFNSVTSKAETSNYSSYSAQRSSDFVTWIQDEGLIDLGFSGPKLTWVKDGSTDAIKWARLDRALCNLEWRIRFPEATVEHLPRIASDHAPLLAAWLAHDDLSKTVQRLWCADQNLLANVQQVAAGLSTWNREVFGNKLRLELEEILYQEELLWFQQSREDWITSGDRNTAYYHAAATVRRARNRVARLLDNNGAWITDDAKLRDHIQKFYINLFTECREVTDAQILEARFPRLRRIDWTLFNRQVTKDEVYGAVCDMKPSKAPGPDGLPAWFYQHTWEVTGDSI